MESAILQIAMDLALREAWAHRGATAPNPPVGATGLDSEGVVLGVAAHLRAGQAHAEVRLIEDLRARGLLGRLHTLVVTLEPCAHHGRTPPCVDAILACENIESVVVGAKDPNPLVAGKGYMALLAGGLSVRAGVMEGQCRDLIGPFSQWIRTHRPWVTVKRALDAQGSMIPPAGAKTFTSQRSLLAAHELRKRADAILTGSGTVLADNPEFTVRHLPDHPGKQRILALMDRRGRVPASWIAAAEARGFRVIRPRSLEEALDMLGAEGVLEVLVEAGPALSGAVMESGLWNEEVLIHADTPEDRIEIRRKETA